MKWPHNETDMARSLIAGQNCWAVICSEPDAPGVWGTWVKERCVALGWPPSKYHLQGKSPTSSWEKAKRRASDVKPGDIIIPFLRHHTFGVPGIVKRIAITDDEWNPTVSKGGFARNRSESELGRRIEVEWLKKGVPPLDKVAVMPSSVRRHFGEVRASIEPVRPIRYARFMKIISGRRNWKKYESEKPSVDLTAATKGGRAARPIRDNRPEQRDAASLLVGHELYLERARDAFPMLVRQAHARQTIFYSDLAGELNMSNPRNLNYVL